MGGITSLTGTLRIGRVALRLTVVQDAFAVHEEGSTISIACTQPVSIDGRGAYRPCACRIAQGVTLLVVFDLHWCQQIRRRRASVSQSKRREWVRLEEDVSKVTRQAKAVARPRARPHVEQKARVHQAHLGGRVEPQRHRVGSQLDSLLRAVRPHRARRVGGTIQQHVACEVMTQRADEYGELGDAVPDGHGDDEVLRRDVHDV